VTSTKGGSKTPKVVNKSIVIDRPVDVVFKIFTEEIDQWWPEGYSIAGAGATTYFEGGKGGRLIQRTPSGIELTVGKILAFDPPNRLVVTWKQAHWEGETEVEVLFRDHRGGTKVDLEHRGWENLGKWANGFRQSYASGWVDILSKFQTHVDVGDEPKPRITRAKPSKADRVLEPQELDPELQRILKKPTANGVVIHSLRGESTPFKVGDIIVSFNGVATPDWPSYYKQHTSVRREAVVFEVIRDGKKIKVESPRDWIAWAGSPLLRVQKGVEIHLRPPSTGASIDLDVVAGGRDHWFKFIEGKSKQIGYEHHVWVEEKETFRFIHESAYESWGLHHDLIESTLRRSDARPVATKAANLIGGSEAIGKLAKVGGEEVWRTERRMEGQVERTRIPIISEALPSLLAMVIAPLLPKEEGATFHSTPFSESTGEIGFGMATVCRGRDSISIGRKNVDAWRYEHLRLDQIRGIAWVDDEGLIRFEDKGVAIIRSTKAEALKGLHPKLKPRR
jgi:uncharacterized protein YndB with AHSA1/START domain